MRNALGFILDSTAAFVAMSALEGTPSSLPRERPTLANLVIKQLKGAFDAIKRRYNLATKVSGGPLVCLNTLMATDATAGILGAPPSQRATDQHENRCNYD